VDLLMTAIWLLSSVNFDEDTYSNPVLCPGGKCIHYCKYHMIFNDICVNSA